MSNCKIPSFFLHIGTTYLHFNQRLLLKSDIGVITSKLTFTIIYSQNISRVYSYPTGKLTLCTGDTQVCYPCVLNIYGGCIWFYIWSYWYKYPVTYISWYNPIILGTSVI